MNLPLLPNMPWGQDKSWHFLTGLPGGATVALIAHYLGSTHSWLTVIIAGAFVGAMKEGYDYLQNQKAAKAGLPLPHSVELMDAASTTLGFAVGGFWIFTI